MKFLLTTTTGIAALVAGAGIAMAQDQSAASTSSSVGADVTCADIANLGEDEAERALYFLAGLNHGQDSAGMSGASGMSGDSAAAMPSTDTGSSSSAASSMPTDGGAPSTDSASTTTPGGDAQGSSGMAESPSAPLPADSTASATGAAPADSGGAGSTTGTDTAASSVPSGDQTGTDTAASSVPSGDQSGSASQDTAGAVPGIESDSGDDSMQDLAEADSGIDQTTTAGVSGSASGSFSADGFYEIPVDMVMADCRTSPDSSVSEILGQHNSN